MVQSSRQLQMSFEGDQRLANRLRAGQFCVVLEVNSPPLNQPLDSCLANMNQIFQRVASLPAVQAVAVTDRWPTVDRQEPLIMAEKAAEETGKTVQLTISGLGADLSRTKTLLAEARAKAIRHFLLVTGDLYAKSDTAHEDAGWLDGVTIVEMSRQFGADMWNGAAVNPYKYTCEGVYLQYAKMQRKIQFGTDFLVAQAGWDMKKAQELQWFLQMRELYLPVMARTVLLGREEALHLADGLWPGVYVPIPLAALIIREANASEEAFWEAQLNRLALQMVGYWRLGYSGVQVTGVRHASHLAELLDRMQEHDANYPDYSSWREAWLELHGEISFGPGVSDIYPDPPYYMFKELMQPEVRDFVAGTIQPAFNTIAPPSWQDRWQGWLHRPTRPAMLQEMARKIARRSQEEAKQANFCQGLRNDSCPKRLIYGACGGSSTDGMCENGDKECFFHRVIRLANSNQSLESLESGGVTK